MADLRKITELDLIESVENVDGVSIIANDNGQAKQIPASLLGGLSGSGGVVCYYVTYGQSNIYVDEELTTTVKRSEMKEAMLNKQVALIDVANLYDDHKVTFATRYVPYNYVTANIYDSYGSNYKVDN